MYFSPQGLFLAVFILSIKSFPLRASARLGFDAFLASDRDTLEQLLKTLQSSCPVFFLTPELLGLDDDDALFVDAVI